MTRYISAMPLADTITKASATITKASVALSRAQDSIRAEAMARHRAEQLTWRGLARKAGLHESVIKRFVAKKCGLSPKNLRKLSILLGL